MSYRCKVFDKFPPHQHPRLLRLVLQYQRFVALLVKTLHPGRRPDLVGRAAALPYATLEYGSATSLRYEETLTITALFQAITAKLALLRLRS
jgi:hypothetical protein